MPKAQQMSLTRQRRPSAHPALPRPKFQSTGPLAVNTELPKPRDRTTVSLPRCWGRDDQLDSKLNKANSGRAGGSTSWGVQEWLGQEAHFYPTSARLPPLPDSHDATIDHNFTPQKSAA